MHIITVQYGTSLVPNMNRMPEKSTLGISTCLTNVSITTAKYTLLSCVYVLLVFSLQHPPMAVDVKPTEPCIGTHQMLAALMERSVTQWINVMLVMVATVFHQTTSMSLYKAHNLQSFAIMGISAPGR